MRGGMKVLWFADVQLPAVTGDPPTGGGWVESLRRALEDLAPDIELGIAAPGSVTHAPFSSGNATYFHIAEREVEGRAAGLVDRWRHSALPDGALASCVAIAKSFAPEVIHVHGAEHYFGLVAPLADAPCVISLQGIATVLERYQFSGLRWSEALREVPSQSFLRGYGPIHRYWSMRSRAILERRIMGACDHFMGRTQWDADVLRVLRPGAQYHEVGELLGTAFYETSWSGPPANDDVLFCTAGASPLKGVECLLEALILRRRAGEKAVRLRLAGPVVDGALARKIAALLAAPELRGSVDVLGRCSPDVIAAELACASAFALPSHMDNSPNSLCEAMLVGTPCIAAFVGGVPSLVRDGVDGLLYHDSDPFALAGKVERLLGDHDLARRLGAEARATARRRHDPQRIVASLVATYREIRGGAPERGDDTCTAEVEELQT